MSEVRSRVGGGSGGGGRVDGGDDGLPFCLVRKKRVEALLVSQTFFRLSSTGDEARQSFSASPGYPRSGCSYR